MLLNAKLKHEIESLRSDLDKAIRSYNDLRNQRSLEALGETKLLREQNAAKDAQIENYRKQLAAAISTAPAPQKIEYLTLKQYLGIDAPNDKSTSPFADRADAELAQHVNDGWQITHQETHVNWSQLGVQSYRIVLLERWVDVESSSIDDALNAALATIGAGDDTTSEDEAIIEPAITAVDEDAEAAGQGEQAEEEATPAIVPVPVTTSIAAPGFEPFTDATRYPHVAAMLNGGSMSQVVWQAVADALDQAEPLPRVDFPATLTERTITIDSSSILVKKES